MITLDAITLPFDLVFTNEFAWSPITQSVNKSLSGALIVEEHKQLKGRRIILDGGTDGGWIDRATLLLLKAKMDTVDLQMVLDVDGNSYNVIFDQSNNPIDARQIIECSDPTATSQYHIKLSFIEV